MFESVIKVLSQYLKIDDRQLWRFDVYSIQVERGQNPEDLYYLCNVRDAWYVVFETDYIFSLQEAAQEAADIFESDKARVPHWLAKLAESDQTRELPLEAAADKSQYHDLVLDVEGTYLRCAVLALDVQVVPRKRYDPNAYGYTT